jgi:hypothetical protein
MPSADDALRARIEAFTAAITTLIRRSVLEAVDIALEGVRPSGAAPAAAASPKAQTPAPRKPVVARVASAAAPAKAGALKVAASRRTPGKKRPPGEIQALIDKVAGYLARHPGATMEELRDALVTPSVELVVPTKKLLAAGKIRAEGKKQLTRYFPV